MYSFQRYLKLSLRSRKDIVLSFFQPLIYLILFGPLFVSAVTANGLSKNSAYTLYVAGLSIQIAMTMSSFAGLTLILEYRLGILERIWATPVNLSSILAGRIARDVFLTLLPIAVVFGCGCILGIVPTFIGLLVFVFNVVMTSVAFASLSYVVAVHTKSESILSAFFNLVLLPILLLSGIMLPLDFAPYWMRWIAQANPLWFVVRGVRTQFGNSIFTHEALLSLIVSTLLAVITYLCAVASLNRRR